MNTTKLNKYEEVLDNSKTMKLMHRPGESKESKVLYSIHQRGKHKTLWYMSSWELMEAQNSPTNPELVTYKSKIYPFHSLYRSVLTTRTPAIKVAEGYQVRFCQDLFINMVRDYRLFLNDIELQYGNNKSLDFELKNQSNWDVMSQDIGNKSQLTDWSNELKSQDLALYLPWFYSQDKSDAFPLKYCGNGDRLHHSVEFNLSLSQLLLIRDSDGNLVDFDKDLLTVSGNLDSVPIPEMEGLYSLLTNKEVDISDGKADEVNGEKELFTRSTYYIEDENDVPMGKKVQLKIDTKSRQPVYSVYWGAVNKTKSDELKTNVLHYRKDDEDFSPIKYSKFETSIGTILDSKSSYKTERAYNLPRNSGIINYRGMNYWCNSVLDQEEGKKFSPGIVMGGGQFTVMLKEKDHDDKYVVFAVLNHVRRFRFKSFPKNQQERLTRGCTIEPDEDD